MHAPIKTVGAYEAKTHLPSLLAQVAKGKEIVITKHDKPIARLVPVAEPKAKKDILQRLLALRGRMTLPPGETVKDLINAGRRI